MYSISGDTLVEEAILEKHQGAITVIKYSPDISMIASRDSNGEVVVWDRTSGEYEVGAICLLQLLNVGPFTFSEVQYLVVPEFYGKGSKVD
ncbi:hypothetical protein TanjilG_21898 [Lupinus angustifolius]|uniref:Uncharacterized protein n=1 Tax=Lupinus angustifolius TaxID=3871 RepID=A0A1J7FND8_LUPAN|nr:hypothetical protein TanjilG_21898 [Lupinus angustifolius]